MDLVWIVGGTLLFWLLIGRPLTAWLETFRGVRLHGRSGEVDEHPDAQ